MTNWENIVEDKELDKAAKLRRNPFNERKDYTSAKDDIESEGWTAVSQYANPKFTKYRKEKPIGEQFEDSVWMMFYNMGFYAMNKDNQFRMDEFHLLLKEEQTAAYSVEIWKRFRKWGGIPTGITQNVKDLLSSHEVENIFENSDFIYMLNQAAGDRQILAKQLNISPHQLSYVTHSGEGEGLLFYGNVILPFVDRFPQDTELYRIMTTKLSEVVEAKEA